MGNSVKMRDIISSLTLLLLWGLIHQTAGAGAGGDDGGGGLIHQTAGASESPVTCYSNNTACEAHEDNLLDTVGGVLSIEDCRLLCYDNDDCGFITYFGMDSFPLRGICQLFLSCDTVHPCSNCVSETRECYRTCGTNYSGRISENLLDAIPDVGQEVDCKSLCLSNKECTFYTYFLATDINSPFWCFLLSGIEEPIESCENCVTGPANCDGETTVSSTTTTTKPCTCDIVPGEDYLYLGPDLILHLPDFKQITCEQNFPGSLSFATAGLVMSGGAERLMMCGGEDMTTCWMLETGGWVDMQQEFSRYQAASSPFGTSHLVTGGWTPETVTALRTTQIYSEDQWRRGPELPQPVGAHCQVEMDGAAYIIGGSDYYEYLNSVYKLEQGAAAWAAVSSLNTARSVHSCAVLDSLIYVMGGWNRNTVEVYDPASDTWTYGPVLPTDVSRFAQAIAYGGTVYVIDGSDDYDSHNVYSYTPGPGAEWETLPGVSVSYSDRPVFPAPVVTTDTLFCVTSG